MYAVRAMTNEDLIKEIASLPEEARRRIEKYISYMKGRYENLTKENKPSTKLEDEEFVGMWADREDMKDSTAWVKKIRREHWGGNK